VSAGVSLISATSLRKNILPTAIVSTFLLETLLYQTDHFSKSNERRRPITCFFSRHRHDEVGDRLLVNDRMTLARPPMPLPVPGSRLLSTTGTNLKKDGRLALRKRDD